MGRWTCTSSSRSSWPSSSARRRVSSSRPAIRPTSEWFRAWWAAATSCSSTSSTTPRSWTAPRCPTARRSGSTTATWRVSRLDKLDHASIVDGAKMSYGETIRFNHGDLAGLERKLQRVPAGTGLMIIVDGVYSMEGDIADVPGLLKIAQKYGAALVLDDAHAVGVLGPRGDGTAAHFGLTDDVDLIVGTFSKSLASIGGFAAAAESVIHFLKHNSRPI